MYDIGGFLEWVHGLDRPEIIARAQREVADLERQLSPGSGRRALPGNLERDALRYRREFGNFVFLVQCEHRPAGATPSELALYRPLCERLVKKGQFKPAVLELFDSRPAQ